MGTEQFCISFGREQVIFTSTLHFVSYYCYERGHNLRSGIFLSHVAPFLVMTFQMGLYVSASKLSRHLAFTLIILKPEI